MKTLGVSHVALAVGDMERSLHFYRDLLGFRITHDVERPVGWMAGPGEKAEQRRAVYLRWEDGPQSAFIVLSEYPTLAQGGTSTEDRAGIHHFSLWVQDLRAMYEKLQAEGIRILLPLRTADTVDYGEKPGGKVLTAIFQDSDGIVIQLDERLS